MGRSWYLRPLPEYKHYGSGATPNPRPWLEVTDLEVHQWRARNLEERWATEDGIARCLCWLEKEFGSAP